MSARRTIPRTAGSSQGSSPAVQRADRPQHEAQVAGKLVQEARRDASSAATA